MSRTHAWVEIQRELKRFHLNPLHFDPHGPHETVLRLQDLVVHITVQPRTMSQPPKYISPYSDYEFAIKVSRSANGQVIQVHHAFCPSVMNAIGVMEWIFLSYMMNTQKIPKKHHQTAVMTAITATDVVTVEPPF